MNSQRTMLIPIILSVIISAIIFGSLGYYLAKNKYTHEPTSNYTTSDQLSSTPTATASTISNKDIEAAAYAAVDKSKTSTWDKKVEITQLDATQKAAIGKWYAHDAWDWIAWQQTDGKWNVLVSKDGFNCKELDTVPSEYNSFFQDVIYMFDTNTKYCL